MRIRIDHAEWKSLINERLKIKAPLLIEKMAYNVIANTASDARKREQVSANSLELGHIQHTSRRRADGSIEIITRRMLRPSAAGWVSTTRISDKGNPFRMSSFSWERERKPSVKAAEYTNQLANLWHRRTKPYAYDSPVGGRGTDRSGWGRFAKQGESREMLYNWSSVASMMASAAEGGIAKTEKQFDKFLKEI